MEVRGPARGPELVLALFAAFAACGLVFVVAGGVAIGIRLARA